MSRICWWREQVLKNCARILFNAYSPGIQLTRWSAGKYLARTGKKQATATRLGIYSTYSPRSSIHFLARYSNFCKALKIKFRILSVQPGLLGSHDLCDGWKMATFQLFFQSREQVVVRRGQIRRIGWVIKILEAQVGQFLLGCKCPVRRDIVMQEQDHFGDILAAFFLQNVLQFQQQRWLILRVDSLALWKIINEKDAVLIPKNWGEKFSSGFLDSEFFWGGVSRYVATPLIFALSPGHSDINMFRPWSPIATGNHLDRTQKKIQNLLRRPAPLTFLIRVQAFRDPLRGELTHVQIFMNDGPNPLMWDAHLLSYWFSRNPTVFQD